MNFFQNDIALMAAVLGGAVLLDFLLGDPRGLPHPVSFLAKFAARLETFSRRLIPSEVIAGAFTATLVVMIGAVLPGALVYGIGTLDLLNLSGMSRPGAALLALLFIWSALAARSMVRHSQAVEIALRKGDLDDARMKTGWIVGRQTAELESDQLIRATVESVAESTVDGVTGVLFFGTLGAIVFGIPGAAAGAWFFRSVNTLDSLFGHKNEKYLYFGRFAARLDDLACYLPARLSPPLMALAALALGENARDCFRVWLRDGSKHMSPNSGQCEAACAGALGIELGGKNIYQGREEHRPTLGDPNSPRTPEHIRRANRLLLLTTLLFTAVCAGALLLFARITSDHLAIEVCQITADFKIFRTFVIKQVAF